MQTPVLWTGVPVSFPVVLRVFLLEKDHDQNDDQDDNE